MAYADVRSALETILGAVAGITKVHVNPPNAINSVDLPCLVFYGSRGSAQHMMGGAVAVEEEHTERVRLLLADSSSADGTARLHVLRAALMAALRPKGGLNSYGVISGIAWTEPALFEYAGKMYVGQDLLLTFKTNPVT